MDKIGAKSQRLNLKEVPFGYASGEKNTFKVLQDILQTVAFLPQYRGIIARTLIINNFQTARYDTDITNNR